jgi:hypothetical protein
VTLLVLTFLAGLVVGAALGRIDRIPRRQPRALRPAWLHDPSFPLSEPAPRVGELVVRKGKAYRVTQVVSDWREDGPLKWRGGTAYPTAVFAERVPMSEARTHDLERATA